MAWEAEEAIALRSVHHLNALSVHTMIRIRAAFGDRALIAVYLNQMRQIKGIK